MDQPIVSYTRNFFYFDGHPFFLFSGDFDYFRSLKDLWEDRLEKMRQCFINTVTSSIPWNYHESSPGNYDFSNNKDLGHFIGLADKLQMFCIPRPGPYIGTDWSGGGHPGWLLDSDIQFFGVVSRFFRTHDTNFLRFSELWFSTVNSILSRFDIKKGDRGRNILLYQIDSICTWDEIKFHHLLKQLVEKQFGTSVPVISVGCEGVLKAGILESYYLKLESHFEKNLDDYFLKIRNQRHSFPPMVMGFQCGATRFLGIRDEIKQKTVEEEIDPVSTGSLIREMFIEGISGFNFTSYNSGINWNYFTRKMGTTVHGFKSPISEWGGLNDNWYKIKVMGCFFKSFKEIIADLYPSDKEKHKISFQAFDLDGLKLSKLSINEMTIKARLFQDEKQKTEIKHASGFILVKLLQREVKSVVNEIVKIKFTNEQLNQYEQIFLTRNDPKLLPISIPISDWIILEFSSMEPFLKINNKIGSNDSVTILFRDDVNDEITNFVYFAIKNPFNCNVNESDVKIEIHKDNSHVNYEFIKDLNSIYKPDEEMVKIKIKSTICKNDNFILIKFSLLIGKNGKNINHNLSRNLIIGFINNFRAERTWIIDFKPRDKIEGIKFSEFAIPIVTDFEFIRNAYFEPKNRDSHLFLDAISGFNIDLESKNSISDISIPFGSVINEEEWQIIARELDSGKPDSKFSLKGGKIIDPAVDDGLKLLSFKLSPEWDIKNNPNYIVENFQKEITEKTEKDAEFSDYSDEFENGEILKNSWSFFNELDSLLLEDKIIRENNLNSLLWKECDPFVGFELNGIYECGYAIYRGFITLTKKNITTLKTKQIWITIPRVADVCWVFVNGYYLGKVIGFGTLQIPTYLFDYTDNNLRITLYVESVGRTDGGRMEKSGLLSPIYLDSSSLNIKIEKTKVKIIPLADLWHKTFKKDLWPGAKPPMGKPELEKIQLIQWDFYVKEKMELEEINEDNPLIQKDFGPKHPSWEKDRWNTVVIKDSSHLGLEKLAKGKFMTVIYRTEFNVPDEWSGSAITLDIENFSGSYWIFFNGKEITTGNIEHFWSQHQLLTPLSVDLTKYIDFDSGNTLAILVVSPFAGAGISGDVHIIKHDYSLEGRKILPIEWFVHEGTLGESFGIHKELGKLEKHQKKLKDLDLNLKYEPLVNLNEINYKFFSEPTVIGTRSLTEKMFWIRTEFKYFGPIKSKLETKQMQTIPDFNYETYFIPLFLSISEEIKGKINIYLNGSLIGRYWDVGPQSKFYLPEQLLKRNNVLTFFVNTDVKDLDLDDKFKIGTFNLLKKIKIKTKLADK